MRRDDTLTGPAPRPRLGLGPLPAPTPGPLFTAREVSTPRWWHRLLAAVGVFVGSIVAVVVLTVTFAAAALAIATVAGLALAGTLE